MKRLVDIDEATTFKNWIIQHNPKIKWNFDNPKELMRQFCDVVAETGDIDLRTVFMVMFPFQDSGLTHCQNNQFLKKNY